MKNVTITMEDHVADWARVEAAKRNQSLSRMLGDLLADKMRRDDAYEQARREAMAFAPIAFTAPYLSRSEMYAERLDRFR